MMQGVDPALARQLLAYRDLLARWNRVYNLSAVRDPEAMVSRHLLDSLAVLPWLPAGPLLDVGTGAGLPGIPIALAEPDRPVTLLESNSKKSPVFAPGLFRVKTEQCADRGNST